MLSLEDLEARARKRFHCWAMAFLGAAPIPFNTLYFMPLSIGLECLLAFDIYLALRQEVNERFKEELEHGPAKPWWEANVTGITR